MNSVAGITRLTRSSSTCESLPPENETRKASMLLLRILGFPKRSASDVSIISKLSQSSFMTTCSFLVFLEIFSASWRKSTSFACFDAFRYLLKVASINSMASCSMRKIESSLMRRSISISTGEISRLLYPSAMWSVGGSKTFPPLTSSTSSPL